METRTKTRRWTLFSMFIAVLTLFVMCFTLSYPQIAQAKTTEPQHAKVEHGQQQETYQDQILPLAENGIVPQASSSIISQYLKPRKIGYYATGKLFKEAYSDSTLYDDIEDTEKNIFVLENDIPIPGDTELTYCFVIQTDEGMFFITDPKSYEEEWSFDYYSLDENSYKTETIYYNDTTIDDFLKYSSGESEEDVTWESLFDGFTKVTADNTSQIPYPDASDATTENPMRVVLNLWAYYNGNVYPADQVPSYSNVDGLAPLTVFAPFTIENTTTSIVQDMARGIFQTNSEEFSNVEYFSLYIGLPKYNGYNFEIADAIPTVESNGKRYLAWYIPAGTPMCATFWTEEGKDVVLQAAIENHETEEQTPITNYKYKTNYNDFIFDSPSYGYEIVPTEVVSNPGADHFVDVEKSAWYYDDVSAAAGLDYMNGYNPFFFGPVDNITRAQIATVLFNMSGWTEDTYNVSKDSEFFPDVAEDAYYYVPVEWAAENGVVTGYTLPGGAMYGPNDQATREQFMTMIHRYAKLAQGDSVKTLTEAEVDEILAKFPDGGEVSNWARESVAWCIDQHVVTGYDLGDGLFMLGSHDNITRAQTAAISVRFQAHKPAVPLGK